MHIPRETKNVERQTRKVHINKNLLFFKKDKVHSLPINVTVLTKTYILQVLTSVGEITLPTLKKQLVFIAFIYLLCMTVESRSLLDNTIVTLLNTYSH